MDCPEASFWCWVLPWFFALAIFTKMYLRSDDELIKIRVSTFREGDDFEQHATSQWPANPEHYDCQPSDNHTALPIVHLSIHPSIHWPLLAITDSKCMSGDVWGTPNIWVDILRGRLNWTLDSWPEVVRGTMSFRNDDSLGDLPQNVYYDARYVHRILCCGKYN